MSYELLKIAAKQSVKELHIYMNKEKQRRLKEGTLHQGLSPTNCPTGPFYLISFSDELLIIISGSSNFFLTPLPPQVRGFHRVTRQ